MTRAGSPRQTAATFGHPSRANRDARHQCEGRHHPPIRSHAARRRRGVPAPSTRTVGIRWALITPSTISRVSFLAARRWGKPQSRFCDGCEALWRRAASSSDSPGERCPGCLSQPTGRGCARQGASEAPPGPRWRGRPVTGIIPADQLSGLPCPCAALPAN